MGGGGAGDGLTDSCHLTGGLGVQGREPQSGGREVGTRTAGNRERLQGRGRRPCTPVKAAGPDLQGQEPGNSALHLLRLLCLERSVLLV